ADAGDDSVLAPTQALIPEKPSASTAGGFSTFGPAYADAPPGAMAEWLRSGLQSRSHRFDSGWRLFFLQTGFPTDQPGTAVDAVHAPHQVVSAPATVGRGASTQ